MPKISFVVPVYNASKYLKECINSIVAQSFDDIEIIAVNDGSTDDSLEILRAFSDKRIKIIDQKNAGASAARNAGILVASGEYIICVDSDDLLDKDCAKLCYEMALSTKADIVVYDYEEFGASQVYKVNFKGADGILDKKRYFNLVLSSNKALPNIVTKMVKSEIFKNNLFPTDFFLGEDLATVPRLVWSAKRMAKINKALYLYRRGENNTSAFESVKNINDIKKSLNSLIKFCSKIGRDDMIKVLEARKIKSAYLPVILSKADLKNPNFKAALDFLKADLEYINSLECMRLTQGWFNRTQKIRLKYKLIFRLIAASKSDEKICAYINFFNSINNFFSKRKIKDFKA